MAQKVSSLRKGDDSVLRIDHLRGAARAWTEYRGVVGDLKIHDARVHVCMRACICMRACMCMHVHVHMHPTFVHLCGGTFLGVGLYGCVDFCKTGAKHDCAQTHAHTRTHLPRKGESHSDDFS